MVTAREFWHSSMTSMRSLVVPNVNSRTMPACPSLSVVSSEKRGTIRPPVAIAISYNNNKMKGLHTSFHSCYILTETNLDFGSAHPSDSGQLSVK